MEREGMGCDTAMTSYDVISEDDKSLFIVYRILAFVLHRHRAGTRSHPKLNAKIGEQASVLTHLLSIFLGKKGTGIHDGTALGGQ